MDGGRGELTARLRPRCTERVQETEDKKQKDDVTDTACASTDTVGASTMAASLRPALQVVWLGRVPYAPVYALQRRLVKDHRAEVVLALEHTPTYTVGRRITGNTAERDRLRAFGAEYFEVRPPSSHQLWRSFDS